MAKQTIAKTARQITLNVVAPGLTANWGSADGPFVLDDLESIVENSTIRDLGDWRRVLFPPNRSGTTVDGRPWLNLSLAVKYHFHRLQVSGYHYFNIALHLTNAVLLWLLTREVLRPLRLSQFFGPHARLLATCIAGLWIVHPLTTAAILAARRDRQSAVRPLVPQQGGRWEANTPDQPRRCAS